VKRLLEIFAHIYVLVNNLVMICGSLLLKVSREQWGRVMEVDFKSYFNSARHEVSLFKDRGLGINTDLTFIKALPDKFVQSRSFLLKTDTIEFINMVTQEFGARVIKKDAVALYSRIGFHSTG
jgi:3-oxoacyl-[acyl-carrier protein] reductase